VARVVVGVVDPNPKVSGRGIQALREAGVEVHVGCLEEEGEELIRWFRKWVCEGIPYGYAKWAMTLDGKIATSTRDSKWISGAQSRKLVHQLRSDVDAILVGVGTVCQDDPRLTSRIEGGRNPLRVVVDTSLRISPECRLVQTAREVPTVVATTSTGEAEKRDLLESLGVEVREFGEVHGRVDLRSLARWLAGDKGVTRLLFEGGAEVFFSAFAASLVDEVWVFIAPKVIGGRDALGAVGGHGWEWMNQGVKIEDVRATSVGEDQLLIGRIQPPSPSIGGESR
jgi:diaminohydroxyphosphoribosylaminopyrimidine deaminase/5-amino-6-(5-phosphoribosylamino)uracil reductase